MCHENHDKWNQFNSPLVLRCEPVGRLEGTVDKVDEGPFMSLVARYVVVLSCLSQPVVVLCTSVDPWGWGVVTRVDFLAVTERRFTLLISRNSVQLTENICTICRSPVCFLFSIRIQDTRLFTIYRKRKRHDRSKFTVCCGHGAIHEKKPSPVLSLFCDDTTMLSLFLKCRPLCRSTLKKLK